MNYLQLIFNFQNLSGFSKSVFIFFALHCIMFFIQKKIYHLDFYLFFKQFFQISKLLRGFPKSSILYPFQTLFFILELSLIFYFLILSFKDSNIMYYDLLINPKDFFLKSVVFLSLAYLIRELFLFIHLLFLKKRAMFQELNKITQINHSILAFLLLCINVLFYFSNSSNKWLFLWISFGIFISIFAVMSWIRLFTLAKRYQIFWLYLICYICFLELIPISFGIYHVLKASDILKIL